MMTTSAGAAGGALTVSYQLDEADRAAAARYTATRYPEVQGRLLLGQVLLALVPGATVIVAAYLRLGFVRPVDLLLALLATGMAFFLAGHFLLRTYVRRTLQLSAAGAPRNFSISVGEDGITASSENGNSRLPWAAIQRVDQDRGYIYLPIEPAGLLVIPRRAFADDDAAQTFVAALRRTPAAAG